jgi:hypothetical protein
MFISSASRPKYVHNEHRLHVRGTPEYNPLYDAFQPDIVIPQKRTQNNFRPVTPPPRFVQKFHEIENTYDKPRSYGFDDERKQNATGQHQHSSHCQKKVGEKTRPNIYAILILIILIIDFFYKK